MKKTVIIIIAVILIGAAVWYYFNPGTDILVKLGLKKDTAPLDPKTDTDKAGSSSTSPGGSFTLTPSVTQDANGFPLMPGSRGTYVKNVQKALNDRFGSSLVLDGIYGPKTQRALSVNGYQSTIYYKHYYEILGITV